MRKGEFPDGSCVLRAKIDMASIDVKLRDRSCIASNGRSPPHRDDVVHLPDVRLAHGQSDAIEGVTHSVCTLEFLNHGRSITGTGRAPPRNIRSRSSLPAERHLHGGEQAQAAGAGGERSGAGDDPRMPTLAGCAGAALPGAIALLRTNRVSTRDSLVDVSRSSMRCAST